ncbi:MAG: PriCT-2 domain-containing protein [Bermanella sp.]
MQYQQCTLEDVREALNWLDAGVSRADWVTIGMAIKSEFGDAGRDEFETFSQTSDKYKRADFLATWRSIRAGGAVGIGSLFKQALDAGYKPQKIEYSEQQKQQRQQEYAARAVQREHEAEAEKRLRDQLQRAIGAVCVDIWNSDHLSCEGHSEYLDKKQVPASGAKFVKNAFMIVTDLVKNTAYVLTDYAEMRAMAAFKKQNPEAVSFQWPKHGALVVPMADLQGQLWGLQFITTGAKMFIAGSKKSGSGFLLGAVEDGGVMCLAEGFATAASIHLATGFAVLVCWDAGNLQFMAEQVRATYGQAHLLICGDNDVTTEGNPGLLSAKKSAAVARCHFVVPSFAQLTAEIREVACG